MLLTTPFRLMMPGRDKRMTLLLEGVLLDEQISVLRAILTQEARKQRKLPSLSARLQKVDQIGLLHHDDLSTKIDFDDAQ